MTLLAPLAKEAGGVGLCQKLDRTGPRAVPAGNTSETASASGTLPGRSPDEAAADGDRPRSDDGVFASTRDPDYEAILAMIVAGKEFLECDNTRFDMANFRPRIDWVREIKRYGVLPDCIKPEEVTNVYAVERDYWKSLWYQPSNAQRAALESK